MPSAVGTLQALHGSFVPDNWSVTWPTAAGASAGAWHDTESKMYVPRGTRATSSTT